MTFMVTLKRMDTELRQASGNVRFLQNNLLQSRDVLYFFFFKARAFYLDI